MLRIIHQNTSVRAQTHLLRIRREAKGSDSNDWVARHTKWINALYARDLQQYDRTYPFQRCMRGGACIYAANATKLK